MCGRYVLKILPYEIQQFFDLLRVPDWKPRYNVAPTQTVLAIRDAEDREAFLPKWGLIPSWSKDAKIASSCINARGETVADKPAFRTAFKKRRCIVVADGFYEWRKSDKQPHYISLKEGPMLFAGLWETWNSPEGPVESCSIVTTAANRFMEPLHDRMPVILPRELVDHWLDPTVTDPDELKPLLIQRDGGDMQYWQVGKEVGSVKNQGEQLIVQVAV